MKKSQSTKSIQLPRFTRTEIKKAFQWINNLKPEEKIQFELLARVELAQKLMKEYLWQQKGKRTEKRKQK
ncbi:MAG TPA: hypothetical protein VE978_04020 [Chitinophagales bacterium]|nr:hypothetical protein [Chitinophagales bacterium]